MRNKTQSFDMWVRVAVYHKGSIDFHRLFIIHSQRCTNCYIDLTEAQIIKKFLSKDLEATPWNFAPVIISHYVVYICFLLWMISAQYAVLAPGVVKKVKYRTIPQIRPPFLHASIRQSRGGGLCVGAWHCRVTTIADRRSLHGCAISVLLQAVWWRKTTK